jgi:hypothetical protein
MKVLLVLITLFSASLSQAAREKQIALCNFTLGGKENVVRVYEYKRSRKTESYFVIDGYMRVPILISNIEYKNGKITFTSEGELEGMTMVLTIDPSNVVNEADPKTFKSEFATNIDGNLKDKNGACTLDNKYAGLL